MCIAGTFGPASYFRMDPHRTHDRVIRSLRTADGSATLHHDGLGEPYHSLHGAVQESTHVFIKAGLEASGRPHVRVLEVGLGTGLNLLLTWIRCREGLCTVDYTALEPFPVPPGRIEDLGHCADLAHPGLHGPFMDLMAAKDDETVEGEGGLRFTRHATPVQRLTAGTAFDVVYFDAFAPPKQPDLWAPDVVARMFSALVPGGSLVTYCAKGEVRRTMQAVGFRVERLPGPPGKREMLRATKPVP